MKLTKQTEIAVNILMLCARPPGNAAVTTRKAAAFAGTSKDHAAQVVAKLARAGYLIGTRGRAGGIRLALASSRISVGDVIRLTEPALEAAADWPESASPFDAVVRAATESWVATFDIFTIADLVAETFSGRVGCLDCDLHALIRRGRLLSRFAHDPVRAALSSTAAIMQTDILAS